MHSVTLDQDARRDDGIDGTAEGQEFSSEGEFKGAGDRGFENVFFLDVAFGEGSFGAVYEVGYVDVVPACADDSDADCGAVEFGE